MNKTQPEGTQTVDASNIPSNLIESPSEQRRRSYSMSFTIAISAILGVIIAAGTILGVVGRAFYVSREEYTEKTLKDAEEKTVMRQTMDRVDRTLTRQEAAFERLSDTVQTIKVDMARGPGLTRR